MGLLRTGLFGLCSFCAALCGNFELSLDDVRDTFEEMLHFHVEHRKMTPLLMSRSLKLFIERFDVYKMYLTRGEAQAFFSLPKGACEEAIEAYYTDDFTLFSRASALLKMAIERAQRLREQMERELTLLAVDLEPIRGEIYLSFAEDEERLKERLQKQLIWILMREKERNSLDEWSPKDREKIFSLWERRFRSREEEYITSEASADHYLALHILKALGLSLDAHSSYFSPEEALEMRTALEKQFEGVGIILREEMNGIVITELVKDGPAARSKKIYPGDRIVAVDGRLVDEMTYAEVLAAIKGRGNKTLRLTLRRKNPSEVEEVYLVRERIMMREGRLQVDTAVCGGGQIGILNLPSFYEGSHATSAEGDMRKAIKKLKRQAPLKGVILDLRENAGGFLTQAVKIAGLFITRGVVVISKYASGEIKYLRNLDGQLHFDGPLIILTSRASASAAEIVAQALQDYGVALIVGDAETYGKGTIQYQTVTDKHAKAFYKVTVGRYYTVSGRSTQIEGVKADIIVPTIFSSYRIGERFLEYPLPSDQVASAYIDPLTDVDYKSRSWFQRNYLPNLHQPQEKWYKLLPQLRKNSALRLASDKNFSQFIAAQEKLKGRPAHSFRRIVNPPWGEEDLQLQEAIQIMKDMIQLSGQSQTP